MEINELAQWAAIAFLGIVGIGLTRQLGQFLVSQKEQLELEGPELDKVLSTTLFSAAEFAQVQGIAASSESGITAVIAMSDNCPGCVQAIDALHDDGPPEGVPLVALLSSHSADFQRRVEAAFDLVSLDPGHERAHSAGIRATPFVLLVDAELRVVTRAITADLREVVARWRNDPPEPHEHSPDGDEPNESANGAHRSRAQTRKETAA